MGGKISSRQTYKPYEVFNEKGSSRVVLLCDHATNKIPKKLRNLGLRNKEINKHIGWDIGAALVAKRIALNLDSVLILSGYSRLIIDCNRPFGVPEAFIRKSENTLIPGNMNLSKKNKRERARKYCLPYRTKVEKIINKKIKKKIIPIIVAIHSFTPIYKGVSRPWHLGLLYRKDKRITSLILSKLKGNSLITVGVNQPYKLNLKGDFSIPYFAESKGLPNILFEIRQDLVSSRKGVTVWSNRLSKLLKKIIYHPRLKSSTRPAKDVLLYYKKRNRI